MRTQMTRRQKTRETVQLAMLVALVVVLQLISAIIPPIGGVSITLTLVPVVIGAILFGIKGGAVLGFFFGLIVLINCITGLDPGGNVLWVANPFFTAIICFVKGIAAGIVPAVLYSFFVAKRDEVSNARKYSGVLVAALSAPIVNTGLFVSGMLLFFTDTLYAWKQDWAIENGLSGDTNIIIYIILGIAGLNFVIEFLVNIILAPAITRIVEVVKRKVR